MKKTALITVFAALCSTALFAQGLEINAPIPQASTPLKSTDQKNYTLESQLTKKGLIVMFSCNTCPYVIRSQKRTLEIMNLAKQKGIGMVIINSNTMQRDDKDSYDAMVKYAKENRYIVPYLVDNGEVVEAFGAAHTPEVFLFDGNGKLVYKGAMEDNPSDPAHSQHMYLKDAMSNMLAGVAINPNSTKSIGCSIKNK